MFCFRTRLARDLSPLTNDIGTSCRASALSLLNREGAGLVAMIFVVDDLRG
jgi:hypothetical protein